MLKSFESSKVKLLDEWLGHPTGSIVTVSPFKADDLVDRGVAEFFEKPKDNEVVNEEPKKKRVGRPPKNKMISNSKNK